MSKILPVRAAAARCCWTRRYIILNTGQSGDYLSSRGFNSTERKNAMSNGVVRFLGWRGALIHGDAMVIDRWKWLTKRLRVAKSGESLLDVGCGTGAFTIGFAKKGYTSTGLSWDERNQKVAEERAKLASVEKIRFPIGDARKLGEIEEFKNSFDAIICTENIEHILDDEKLMKDMFGCLKSGGYLYLTTPNKYFRALVQTDNGPYSDIENGEHVRRGYTPASLYDLCQKSGFIVNEIGYCSFWLSQETTLLIRKLNSIFGLKVSWILTLPLRTLSILLDGSLGRFLSILLDRPGYSITLDAYKPVDRHNI